MVSVFLERENKNHDISFNGSAKDLCKKLGVNINTVVVVKNNEIITEQDIISEKDDIKLLSVISGG